MPDIKTLAKTHDIDVANTFGRSIKQLSQMLSACSPIKASVGETLHRKKITGQLTTKQYVKGQEIPESTYTWDDVDTIEVALKPYRKRTLLEEVKKRGYDAAVTQTDRAMLSDIQRDIKKGFVACLSGEGSTSVTGSSLTETAATAWGTLENIAEENSFGDIEPVFFANPLDFARAIGKSEVFSAFGINYIENWAGLGTLVSTGSVAAGTLYVTPKKNIKVYTIPADGDELFGFYSDETGYIAIAHSAELKSIAYDTVAYTGLTFFAEYVDFIVKGTITPLA